MQRCLFVNCITTTTTHARSWDNLAGRDTARDVKEDDTYFTSAKGLDESVGK